MDIQSPQTINEKREVLILASAQALFQTVSVMTMTLAGVIGFQLAEDKALATLPVAAMMLAVVSVLLPASFLMQTYGRKTGFQLGSILGLAGGLTAAGAIWIESFWLFVGATMLIGSYQAFAQYYRFAAAEVANDAFRSRAISWVIAGGVVAAFAGPNIARFTQDIGPVLYVVPFLCMSGLSVVAFIVLGRISQGANDTDLESETEFDPEPARGLLEIMSQKVFLTALIGSTVGFSMMLMVMTATPIAMQQYGFGSSAFTSVIQWHVLAMYLPSFFVGTLIARFGALPIMTAGIAFIGANVGIALSGASFWHFLSGLVFIGLGWNFLFIGGTTLLTEAYRPSERAKTQGAHDFLMFGTVSLASLSAGGLLDLWGWEAVNWAVLPPLLAAFTAVFLYWQSRRKQGQPISSNILKEKL